MSQAGGLYGKGVLIMDKPQDGGVLQVISNLDKSKDSAPPRT